MTKEDLKNILLTSLGYGRVDIELDPAHIDTAITLSLLWLSSAAPKNYSISITAEDGQSRFDLSSIGTDIVVYDVRKSGTAQTDFAVNPFSFSSYVYSQSLDIVDIAVMQNYIEIARKTVGNEFSWKYEPPFLYINHPMKAGEILNVDYIKPYQSVEEVPTKYLPAFIKYAKAELKETLGRIRGKYRGMPAPEGTIEMDYSDLLSEAQTEKQEAIEGLRKIQPAGMFIVG